MAKYYFCNGTKKSNLPCQLAVPEERDRCHFHDGGGGPGPKKVSGAVFKSIKGSIDAMVYLHAAIEASKYFFSISEYGIGLYSELAGFDITSIEDDSFILKLESLSEYYSTNESFITRRISLMDEEGLRHLSAISNYMLAIANKDEEIDGEGSSEMTASY